MAAISFLETSIQVDVSNIAVGSGGTKTVILTKDQRQAFSNTGLTVSICNELDAVITSGLPYHASIAAIDENYYLLTFTFDQPFSQVDFSFNRLIKITNGTDTEFDMRVQMNYIGQYNYTTWQGNSSETSFAVNDIVLKAPLTSSNANTIWRSLLNSAINAYNLIQNLYTKYYYNKYLPDIIDFAIYAGTSLEDNTATLTRDSDGDISTILIAYSGSGRRTPRTLITYNYDSTQHIIRTDDTTPTPNTFDEGAVKLLSSININCVDSSSLTITQIGTITYTRTSTMFIFPDNLANYKKYTIPAITSWTVSGINS